MLVAILRRHMRHLIYLFLTFGLTASVLGQQSKFDIGLEGSPSLIFLHGSGITKQYEQPALGFSGGLSFQYNLPKIFSIRTGIAFERKGAEFNYTIPFTDQYGKPIDYIKNIEHLHFDYLTAPFLLRASVGRKIKYFFNTGFFIGYLIKQTTITEATQYFPSSTTDYTSYRKRFDLGVCAGLGLSIPIANQFSISFEIRDNLGLKNVGKPPVITEKTIKTNSTNFLVGLAFKFSSRQTETK
jgi:hypothetical protein